MTGIPVLAGAIALLLVSTVQGAPLLDTVKLIADSVAAEQAAPAAQTFTVTIPGDYTVELIDLRSPAALTALSVAVATSTASAVQLTAPGTSATKTVTLAAGSYTVQPLATASANSPGTFSVVVTPKGTAKILFQYQWAIAAAGVTPPAGQSLLSTTFKVTQGGNYTVQVTDQNFPTALGSLLLTITPHGSPVQLCTFNLGVTPPCQLSLGPGGVYDIFAIAQPDAAALKGLYSINIVGGTSGTAVAYASTVAAGTFAAPVTVQAPAAGAVSVALNDLSYPAPLASFQAVVVQGASVLQSINAPQTVNVNIPAAGVAQIYYVAAPGGSGEGSFAAYLTMANAALLDTAVAVVDANHLGYTFSTILQNAGAYQFTVTDFKIPAPLTSLDALAEQTGATLATGIGPTNIAAVKTGSVNFVVFTAVPTAGASSLFGVDFGVVGSLDSVFEITQGVGAAFRSQTVDIIQSGGQYVAQLTDLEFPAKLAQVWLIGTRGQSVVTQIIGTGKVAFGVPSSGTYVINVLAQVAAGTHYGLYGLNLDVAPPVPTVTLTASPTNINSGETVTLTWSSTNANTCTAVGGAGWTGQLATTSGTMTTSALMANTTFSLTCTGDGGTSAPTTVLVTVMQPSSGGSGGGGGGIGGADLLLLALAVLWGFHRRGHAFRFSVRRVALGSPATARAAAARPPHPAAAARDR
jgi:hypothetical protein